MPISPNPTPKNILLVAIFLLAAWLMPQFSLAQMKNVERNSKKVYYMATGILPYSPAVKLKVAYHKQEHALSCEIASLLMALKYKTVSVTESELIARIPVADAGARDRKNNTWGDPNLGFVGNIDGKMPNTGYGVYEQPIYDVAVKYRPAKIIIDGSLNDLIAELINDNPVVVWGTAGSGKDISWKTSEGKIIPARYIEHARLLIGFTGTSEKPEKMILLDPVYGEIKMSVKSFMQNWELMDKRAVVVY